VSVHKKRLARLEEGARETRAGEEERVLREAMGRVSDEDLRLLHAYLKRAVEEGGEPTEQEEPAILRYQEIKEEVRHEHMAPH
jgi:hypothetical protein